MTDINRVGVVGVGHLGALHAEKYAERDDVELVGVYDVDPARKESVAKRFGCQAAASSRELFAAVTAVSIAVPVVEHERVGLEAIASGCHLLMEKPLAATVDQGQRLLAAAETAGVVLHVGHIERFNPVVQELRHIVNKPLFVECHRLAPYAGRGVDTDVVLDVMIHDLDLLSFLVGDEIVSIDAVGVPVLSTNVDIANVRLRFRRGCVANVTASRVSLKRERKLRIFQAEGYVSMDFDARSALIAHRNGRTDKPDNTPEGISGMAGIDVEIREFGDADPLAAEIESFVQAIRGRRVSAIGAEEALDALRLAERIRAAMEIPGSMDEQGRK